MVERYAKGYIKGYIKGLVVLVTLLWCAPVVSQPGSYSRFTCQNRYNSPCLRRCGVNGCFWVPARNGSVWYRPGYYGYRRGHQYGHRVYRIDKGGHKHYYHHNRR